MALQSLRDSDNDNDTKSNEPSISDISSSLNECDCNHLILLIKYRPCLQKRKYRAGGIHNIITRKKDIILYFKENNIDGKTLSNLYKRKDAEVEFTQQVKGFFNLKPGYSHQDIKRISLELSRKNLAK